MINLFSLLFSFSHIHSFNKLKRWQKQEKKHLQGTKSDWKRSAKPRVLYHCGKNMKKTPKNGLMRRVYISKRILKYENN